MTANPLSDLRSLDDIGYPDARMRPTAVGTFANRPAVGLFMADAFYFAKDTGILYYSDGTAWSTVSPTVSPVTYRKTTAKTVASTVAATDLLNGEITVAAGAMGATGLLRLTAFGDFKQNSGGNTQGQRFQLVFGGTTLFDTGAPTTIIDSAVRVGWEIVALIQNTAAGAQVCSFKIQSSGNSAVGAAGGVFTVGSGNFAQAGGNPALGIFGQAYNVGALDTTTAKALVLNIINPSASALCETKLTAALVEIV